MHSSTDLVSRPAGETYGFLLPAPYARKLLVGANDSAIVLSSTGAFDVQLYSAEGRLRRRIRFPELQRPVTRAMREEYRARLMRAATDERTRRTWELRSSDDVFGALLPAIDQLRLDRLGLLWVRRSTTVVDAHAEWLVFTQGGSLVARVQAPAMLTLHDILGRPCRVSGPTPGDGSRCTSTRWSANGARAGCGVRAPSVARCR